MPSMDDRIAVVGARLAQARRFNGFSAADVASHLGIARSSLSLYEAGKRDVRISVFLAMADLYRVDVRWLLGYTDEFVLVVPRPAPAYEHERE